MLNEASRESRCTQAPMISAGNVSFSEPAFNVVGAGCATVYFNIGHGLGTIGALVTIVPSADRRTYVEASYSPLLTGCI